MTQFSKRDNEGRKKGAYASPFATLPKFLRKALGLHTKMREPAVCSYAESFAERQLSQNSQDAPASTAGLSALVAITGEDIRKVALFRDVHLPHIFAQCDKQDLQETQQKMLMLARSLRKNYNRLRYAGKGKIASNDFMCLLKTCEKNLKTDCCTHPQYNKIARSLRAHVDFCASRTQGIIENEAHNIVADIVVSLQRALRKPLFSFARLTDSTEREIFLDMRECLQYALGHQAHYSREVAEELYRGDGESLRVAHARLSDHTRTGMSAVYKARDRRSTPADILKSARRSYWANHLVHALQFQAVVSDYVQRPYDMQLQKVYEALLSWQESEKHFPYQGESGAKTEKRFSRNPYSIVSRSDHSYVRDVLLPHIAWAQRNHERFTTDEQASLAHALQCAARIVTSTVSRGIWETPQAAIFTELGHAEHRSGAAAPRSLRQHIRNAAERYIGFRDPCVDPFLLAHLSKRQSIHELHASTKRQATCNYEDGKAFFRAFAQWLRKTEARVEQAAESAHVPKNAEAFSVLEFQFANDAQSDEFGLFQQIEALQRQVFVREEGCENEAAYVESAKSLEALAQAHRGALFCLRKSKLVGDLDPKQLRDVLFLTCSQEHPEPLLETLKELSQDYLKTLPLFGVKEFQSAFVLVDLVLSLSNQVRLVKTYGERPYEMLDEQFVFHLMSTFPAHMFVDCFGICQKGSVALSAHKRFGWNETGASYIDEHGIAYDILHRRISPALRLLGYPVQE